VAIIEAVQVHLQALRVLHELRGLLSIGPEGRSFQKALGAGAQCRLVGFEPDSDAIQVAGAPATII